MDRLAKIARSATPSTGVQFRQAAYGASGARDFLRDVIALANAPVEGSRYIVVGAGVDRRGQKQFEDVADLDFAGKPSYAALAGEFIEPPVRIRYQRVSVEGHQLGVYEIADCQDRPYMMRIDHSESLRRGDAYVRINDSAIKMGRRQLQAMFEQKFRDSVSAADIEVGFPGEIIHKDHALQVQDLEELPSAVAGSKLRQLIRIKSGFKTPGATSMLARLTHARLFGTEDPYQDRSKEELISEMRNIEKQYLRADAHFLFEEHAEPLQLVVYNQGEEAIRDASVSIVMPNHDAFYVASQLPPVPQDGTFIGRSLGEQDSYPSVNLSDDAVHVTCKLGDIPPGEFVDAFETPLRICVGKSLEGRRFGVQYALFAQNLRSPAKGKLRLLFGD